MNPKRLLIWLLLIVGFSIRIIPLLSNTVHFSFDQGLDIAMVKFLVVDHKLNLVSRYSGFQGILMGPFWTWLLAIPFAISGGNPAANIIFMSLMSVFFCFVTFLIIKHMLSEQLGWLIFILTIFSPIYLLGSGVILSPLPIIFISIFYLWSLWEIFVLKRLSFWMLLFLVIGIFFQLELAVAFFSLPSIIITAFFFKSVSPFKSRYFFFGLGILFLTFIPQILFDIRHNLLISHGFINFLISSTTSLGGSGSNLSARFVERLYSLQEDLRSMALVEPLWFSMIMIIISIIGWKTIFTQKLVKEIKLLYLLLAIIVGFYGSFVLYPGPIWGWYRVSLPIVFLLLIFTPYPILWKNKRLRIGMVIIAIYYMFTIINPFGIWSVLTVKNKGGESNLSSQIKILDYIYSNAKSSNFSVFVYTPPVYDYTWQYVFWWYGRNKYGYLPNNWNLSVPLLGVGKQTLPPKSDQGVFYLIIEPDREHPGNPDGWIKSFIKIGKTIDRKIFPEGIIVEKRTT